MAKCPGLIRRGGTYYYRSRVPKDLVEVFGKAEIKESLRTKEYDEAKKRRNERALFWQAQFQAAREAVLEAAAPPQTLTSHKAVQLVQDYVARRDREWRQSFAEDGPSDLDEKRDMLIDAETPIQILKEPADPRSDELVSHAGDEILASANAKLDGKGVSRAEFFDLVERAVLEIHRRKSAVIRQNHLHDHFDNLFAPSHELVKPPVTLQELSQAYFGHYVKQAKHSKIGQKRIDKVQSSISLIEEIIGPETIVTDIDYEMCVNFIETLSRVPKNRRKFYPKLSLEAAMEAADKEGRPPTSYTTQQTHLQTLNAVLKLGVKKGILQVVPSADLSPYAEKTPDADKRKSFTSEQLNLIFSAPLYTGCKNDQLGFSKPGPNVIRRARFWVPLICLFTGMRANEVCQLYVQDLKSSDTGVAYFDIVNDQPDKKIKNTTSRRVFPVHPELVKIGLLGYVDEMMERGEARLFPELKPDKHGYYSVALADWFSSTFLNSVMVKEKGCSLHSLRHNFRDALRLSNAPDWVVQALGGWNQGTKVSDNYGSKVWPDQLYEWVKKIGYEGLDMSHLYDG